jgi:hypothetical protein
MQKRAASDTSDDDIIILDDNGQQILKKAVDENHLPTAHGLVADYNEELAIKAKAAVKNKRRRTKSKNQNLKKKAEIARLKEAESFQTQLDSGVLIEEDPATVIHPPIFNPLELDTESPEVVAADEWTFDNTIDFKKCNPVLGSQALMNPVNAFVKLQTSETLKPVHFIPYPATLEETLLNMTILSTGNVRVVFGTLSR